MGTLAEPAVASAAVAAAWQDDHGCSGSSDDVYSGGISRLNRSV